MEYSSKCNISIPQNDKDRMIFRYDLIHEINIYLIDIMAVEKRRGTQYYDVLDRLRKLSKSIESYLLAIFSLEPRIAEIQLEVVDYHGTFDEFILAYHDQDVVYNRKLEVSKRDYFFQTFNCLYDALDDLRSDVITLGYEVTSFVLTDPAIDRELASCLRNFNYAVTGLTQELGCTIYFIQYMNRKH